MLNLGFFLRRYRDGDPRCTRTPPLNSLLCLPSGQYPYRKVGQTLFQCFFRSRTQLLVFKAPWCLGLCPFLIWATANNSRPKAVAREFVYAVSRWVFGWALKALRIRMNKLPERQVAGNQADRWQVSLFFGLLARQHLVLCSHFRPNSISSFSPTTTFVFERCLYNLLLPGLMTRGQLSLLERVFWDAVFARCRSQTWSWFQSPFMVRGHYATRILPSSSPTHVCILTYQYS